MPDEKTTKLQQTVGQLPTYLGIGCLAEILSLFAMPSGEPQGIGVFFMPIIVAWFLKLTYHIEDNRHLTIFAVVSFAIALLGIFSPALPMRMTILKFHSLLLGLPVFTYSIACMIINRIKRVGINMEQNKEPDIKNKYYEKHIPREKKEQRSFLKTTVLLLGVIPLVIAIFVLYMPPVPQGSRIASHEATAIASLKAIANAQAIFIKTDFYETGNLVYANPNDGCGIWDLYDIRFGNNNNPEDLGNLKLIDHTIANADDSNPNSVPTPKAGYLFHDLECEDYRTQFAALAYPAKYNVTGRNVFVINETGTVYQIDASSKNAKMMDTYKKITPIDKYPTDDELKNWIPAGK